MKYEDLLQAAMDILFCVISPPKDSSILLCGHYVNNFDSLDMNLNIIWEIRISMTKVLQEHSTGLTSFYNI